MWGLPCWSCAEENPGPWLLWVGLQGCRGGGGDWGEEEPSDGPRTELSGFLPKHSFLASCVLGPGAGMDNPAMASSQHHINAVYHVGQAVPQRRGCSRR